MPQEVGRWKLGPSLWLFPLLASVLWFGCAVHLWLWYRNSDVEKAG